MIGTDAISADDHSREPVADSQQVHRLVFRRSFNPAYWYGVLGALLLGATFWFPLATARRTARVETRAPRLAELLLREGMAIAPLDFDDPAVAAMTYGRLVRHAAAAAVFVGDLELLPPQPDIDAITFCNKHHVIQLRPSPRIRPAELLEPEVRPELLPLEVLAWPRRNSGPGHGVFFHPEDADPAFTRNLQFGYSGLDPRNWPQPGHTHRRPDANHQWHYRDYNDERWLLHARPRHGVAPTLP